MATLSLANTARADSHPGGVPVLNSNPGAAYTVYLDFAGFNFAGTWGGQSTDGVPGTTPAYDGVTTTFAAADQGNIRNIWARVAEKYSAFNVNVTTVDPAPAGASDLQRQLFYDSTSQLMHTVIGGNGSWTGGGGISYEGVDQYSFSQYASDNSGAGRGYHTDFVFPDRLGGAGALQNIGEASSHENGHGFGLSHQSDYTGSTLTSEYSSNNNSPGQRVVHPDHGRLILLPAGTVAKRHQRQRRQSRPRHAERRAGHPGQRQHRQLCRRPHQPHAARSHRFAPQRHGGKSRFGQRDYRPGQFDLAESDRRRQLHQRLLRLRQHRGGPCPSWPTTAASVCPPASPTPARPCPAR